MMQQGGSRALPPFLIAEISGLLIPSQTQRGNDQTRYGPQAALLRALL